MLFGAAPVGTTCMSDGSSSSARTPTSPLPAFVTSRCVPSCVRTTDPCEVRCGTPSPVPPVATLEHDHAVAVGLVGLDEDPVHSSSFVRLPEALVPATVDSLLASCSEVRS